MRLVSIVGASGSGKTTLIRRLVSLLSRRGLAVGTLKHAHHDFDMDARGKDSQKHFSAGAAVTCVVSPHRTAVFRRTRTRESLAELRRSFRGCDLVLAEGWRSERLAKIEVFRRSRTRPIPLFEAEGFRPKALVTDDPVKFGGPRFRTADIGRIARFILHEL